MTLGDRVRIHRDEPTKGTWKRYEGKPGVVVMLDRLSDEVGVEVGAVQARYNDRHELTYDHGRVAWFRPSELRPA